MKHLALVEWVRTFSCVSDRIAERRSFYLTMEATWMDTASVSGPLTHEQFLALINHEAARVRAGKELISEEELTAAVDLYYERGGTLVFPSDPDMAENQ